MTLAHAIELARQEMDTRTREIRDTYRRDLLAAGVDASDVDRLLREQHAAIDAHLRALMPELEAQVRAEFTSNTAVGGTQSEPPTGVTSSHVTRDDRP